MLHWSSATTAIASPPVSMASMEAGSRAPVAVSRYPRPLRQFTRPPQLRSHRSLLSWYVRPFHHFPTACQFGEFYAATFICRLQCPLADDLRVSQRRTSMNLSSRPNVCWMIAVPYPSKSMVMQLAGEDCPVVRFADYSRPPQQAPSTQQLTTTPQAPPTQRQLAQPRPQSSLKAPQPSQPLPSLQSQPSASSSPAPALTSPTARMAASPPIPAATATKSSSPAIRQPRFSPLTALAT